MAEFRDKEFGWDSHFESFLLERTGQKVVCNDYATLFSSGILLRPSCHNCPFASMHRPGDLTLGDFWGIGKVNPGFQDDRGVSLLMTSSEAGENLFRQTCSRFDWFACLPDQALQPQLVSPSPENPERGAFWEAYHALPFSRLLAKYTDPGTVSGRIKKRIKRTLYFLKIRKHP